MNSATSPDIEALCAALAVVGSRADEAEARAARMVAEASNAEAIIAALKLMVEKYGQHIPLNRQSELYAREGVELSLSTLADQVGACTFVLRQLMELIAAHVLAA